LIFSGVLLTVVFVALAFLAAVITRDKAKAIGIGLMFWFYATLIYDAFLMWVLFQFSDYPLDTTMLVLISLNPIDLARIILMLQLDISALMGYTGAFYKVFFGSGWGMIYSVSTLFIWFLIPLFISLRIFQRKDM
jgi:Cu-processing system permease protein